MPPRVVVTRAASLAFLASLLPGDSSGRIVEASAVATDDACFYDVASGQCVASAVWVTGQRGLLRTPRANLLADVAAGIETCASAFGDEETCVSHVGTCEYDAGFFPDAHGGFESVGGCFPTLSWAASMVERCLADVSDADATAAAMLATAAACVAHTVSQNDAEKRRESCVNDKKNKCAWTDTDADGDAVPGFCAPDPLPLAVTAVGASGVGALVAAKTACEEIELKTPCDSDPNCEWRSAAGRRRLLARTLLDEEDEDEEEEEDDDDEDSSSSSSSSSSGSCSANVPHVLLDAVTSPAVKAYLERVERCAAGRAGASACASVDPAGRFCAWGKKRSSTNIVPEEYGGDGGDGSGGWVTGTSPGTSDHGSGNDVSGTMSCFPTYASIVDAVAPTLGLATGACGSLAPLFEMAEACAAAGSDRGACDAVGACSYAAPDTASGSESSETENRGRCEMDASAAIEALMSNGDAAVIRAMSAACAEGYGNVTKCESAGAKAATAGHEAAGHENGSSSNTDSSGNTNAETSALSTFVLFCFFFFALVVAPPVAYANHLKNRGEDVCDRLPPWARKYVPAALRPQISQYESFVGQETGDDL